MMSSAFLTRVRAVARALCASALLAACFFPSCTKDDSANTVVLYSSVDEEVIRPLIEAFEKQRGGGFKVLLVGDTEVTKSTGLVQRLLSEKDHPQADVWWSSEALGTAKLSNAGLFAPYLSKRNETDFEKGWPGRLRGLDHDWYGFAPRPRVFVYHIKRVGPSEIPRTLVDFTRERFKGKVGMASPQFGTTRGHIAALRTIAGDEPVDQLLEALKANGLRTYDGNAAVVRAVNLGEIDVGITDADDVNAGKANGWPVAASYESRSVPASAEERGKFGVLAEGTGTFMTPNTVALLKGARHLQAACELVDYILSSDVERKLARSDSANVPVRPLILAEFPALRVENPTLVDWESVLDR